VLGEPYTAGSPEKLLCRKNSGRSQLFAMPCAFLSPLLSFFSVRPLLCLLSLHMSRTFSGHPAGMSAAFIVTTVRHACCPVHVQTPYLKLTTNLPANPLP